MNVSILRPLVCSLAVALALCCGPAVGAENLRQQMVKSAFLLNLAKMSQWPGVTDEHAPLVICLYKNDLLGDGYRVIRDKTVHGRVVRRRLIDSMGQVAACDLLYFSDAELRQFVAESDQAVPLPVLTVVDMTAAQTRVEPVKGVHIMLVRQAKRIGFAVNLQDAKDVGIGFSSELLKLSAIVGRGR